MSESGGALQRTMTSSVGSVAQIGFLNNLLQKLRPIILRKGIEVGAEYLLRPNWFSRRPHRKEPLMTARISSFACWHLWLLHIQTVVSCVRVGMA